MKTRIHFGDYASEDKVKFPTRPPDSSIENIKSDESLGIIFSKIEYLIGKLKDVAITADYRDLNYLPALKDVAITADYRDLNHLPALKDVAITADYRDLNHAPTVMSGATGDRDGKTGFVPTPPAGNNNRFLCSNGLWAVPPNDNTWRSVANNLTTNDPNISLSAAQGVALKKQLDDTKKSVSDGKKEVAAAITAKGVAVTSTDANPATFATLASKIRDITATISITANNAVAKIGNTTVTKNDIGRSLGGTTNPGAGEITLAKAGSLLYCSSDLKVGSLGGNASAGNVLAGKTFSSNTAGRAIAGTMVNRGACRLRYNAASDAGKAEAVYRIPAGFHSGTYIKTLGTIGEYCGDYFQINVSTTGTSNASIWKRNTRMYYSLEDGNRYNVDGGTYSDYRVLNVNTGFCADFLFNTTSSRSAILFFREYTFQDGVYRINNTYNAITCAYIPHGRTTEVVFEDRMLLLTWRNGTISLRVESGGWMMHDFYLNLA